MDETCEEQLEAANKEIAKLKSSIIEWKEAWFSQRQIIGELNWSHLNCPHEIKSAQDPKPNPWLHQGEEFVQEGKLVYMRTVDGWKLVGSSTSVDGGTAVMRLMNMGSK